MSFQPEHTGILQGVISEEPDECCMVLGMVRLPSPSCAACGTHLLPGVDRL